MDILEIRKKGKLHNLVEARLKQLITEVFPTSYTLPEGYGISSGRTDSTIYFVHGGGLAHYELIASESMVFRDVNNLRTSIADMKFVILMDQKIDPKVANSYYRAVPRNEFPTIWLNELMDDTCKEEIKAFLSSQMKELELKVKVTEKKSINIMNSIIKDEKRNGFRIEIVIVPRENIDFLGNLSNSEEAWNNFEWFGISEAVSIEGTPIGKSWRFWNGDFAVIEGVGDDLNYYQSIRITESGDIRLTLFCQDIDPDDLYYKNIFSALIKQKIEQICNFSQKIFKDKKYLSFTDLIFYICGIDGRTWEVDIANPLSSYLGKSTFTVNEFCSEVFPLLVDDLNNQIETQKVIAKISAQLARRTKKIRNK